MLLLLLLLLLLLQFLDYCSRFFTGLVAS